MTRIFRSWGVVSVGLFLLGCSASPAEHDSATDSAKTVEPAAATEIEQSDSVPALVTLDFPDGQIVSFHEMGDVLIVSQRAPNGVPSIFSDELADGASAPQVFELLRPGEPVPATLVEATERVRMARAASEPSSAVLEQDAGGGAAFVPTFQNADAVGTRSEAITVDYFRNTLLGCGPWGGVKVWEVCFPDWYDGFYAYAKSKTAKWRVASGSGTFHVKISASTGGQGSGIFYLAHDTWGEFVALGEPCCAICPCLVHPRTLRIDIINAIGDWFHVGGVWK